MYNIDVCINVSEEESGFKLQHCLESLKNEPVNIVVEPAVPNDLGRARRNVAKRGTADYFCFVDPDDTIESGIFSGTLNQLMKDHPKMNAYYTNHMCHKEGIASRKWFNVLETKPSAKMVKQMHHLVLYKRAFINKYLDNMIGLVVDEMRLINYECVLSGKVVGVDEIGYHWNIYETGAHKKALTMKNPDFYYNEVNRYIKLIKEKYPRGKTNQQTISWSPFKRRI